MAAATIVKVGATCRSRCASQRSTEWQSRSRRPLASRACGKPECGACGELSHERDIAALESRKSDRCRSGSIRQVCLRIRALELIHRALRKTAIRVARLLLSGLHGGSSNDRARDLLGRRFDRSALLIGLIEGEAARDWFIDRCPLKRGHTQRLANVFAEVGRGILIGTGLTALLQGALATVGYFVTGVPQALVLGLLTVLASLIPSVGAALVWCP
jgi:AI-2E family transporter